MIQCFQHAGLQRLYGKADRKELSAHMAPKIERIIARLDVASSPEMMNLPGLELYRLKGNLSGFWSVCVAGNWRIVFRVEGSHVFDVDLIDYH